MSSMAASPPSVALAPGPSSRIEIDEVLDGAALSGLQKWALVLCALSVVLDGYDLQVLALTVPALSKDWSIAPASLSIALSASLLGMGLGAALLAPLGDRFGRRTVLICTLALVGISSLCAAAAHTATQLAVCRFFTGAGMGASLANAYTLAADLMPPKRRAGLTTLAYCNTATGALLAGLSVPTLIADFGWRSTFIAGGALPLLLSLTIWATGPESIKYLLRRRPDSATIPSILARIAPGIEANRIYLKAPTLSLSGSIRDLFVPTYRAPTLLLWLGFAMNSFNLYLLVSWLPTLLIGAGWQPPQAIRAMAFNQIGGIIGGLSLAGLMDRFGPTRMLAAGAAVNAVTLLLFLVVPMGFFSWGALLLLVGACTGGAQFAIVSLAGYLYPSNILATGSGWASAIARIGAFVSPLIGGLLIQQQFAPRQVIAGLAAPAAVGIISMLALGRVRRATH